MHNSLKRNYEVLEKALIEHEHLSIFATNMLGNLASFVSEGTSFDTEREAVNSFIVYVEEQ